MVNTSDFDSGECRFESYKDNQIQYIMEAEELLKYLKKCVEEKLGTDFEPIITPTMYDPTKMQYDVSFIIMEKIEGGCIPRFTVNVKDNTKRNFN